MKYAKLRNQEQGIAHLGLILVIIVIIAVGALVYWRFQSTDSSESTEATSSQSEDQEEASLNELDKGLADVEQNSEIATEQEDTSGEE